MRKNAMPSQQPVRPYRGRFAPTPSGPLHFGSLVAAVGSYLEARSHGGEWHLRIDDLDAPRVAPGAADAILSSLVAFGFEWDGPVLFQSQRTAAYHAALHQLRHVGVIYPCACSRSEIEAVAASGSEGPIYPGTCRGGLAFDRRARAWRMRLENALIEFEDGLLGIQRLDLAREVGDFAVYRADGVYAFHLASSVDDAELAVTDIVRGADLLESSARQIYVLSVLHWPAPRYVHLPVAVDASGAKLSKQTGAAAIDATRPVSMLCAVMRFLNQAVSPELEHASLEQFWAYAIAHWDLGRVGARRNTFAPG
jgi:glutamyl-Q tRNA(Asp) synthetase